MDSTLNSVHRLFLKPRDYHYRIVPVFNAVQSEGLKITGIQYWFTALFLAPRAFSKSSKSSDDIMYCRLWDIPETIMSLYNFTLRNITLKLFHNLKTHFLLICECLPILLFCTFCAVLKLLDLYFVKKRKEINNKALHRFYTSRLVL